MKTIEEHNKERMDAFAFLAKASRKSGVACPKCKAEMLFTDDSVRLSMPPQRAVNCECGHHDFIIA